MFFDDLQITTLDVEALWGPWLQDCSETTWTEGSSRSPWHHLGQWGEMSQFLVEMCFSDVLNDKCSFRINWWPKEKNPKNHHFSLDDLVKISASSFQYVFHWHFYRRGGRRWRKLSLWARSGDLGCTWWMGLVVAQRGTVPWSKSC